MFPLHWALLQLLSLLFLNAVNSSLELGILFVKSVFTHLIRLLFLNYSPTMNLSSGQGLLIIIITFLRTGIIELVIFKQHWSLPIFWNTIALVSFYCIVIFDSNSLKIIKIRDSLVHFETFYDETKNKELKQRCR